MYWVYKLEYEFRILSSLNNVLPFETRFEQLVCLHRLNGIF